MCCSDAQARVPLFLTTAASFNMTTVDPTKSKSFNQLSVRLSTGRVYHVVDQAPTSGTGDAPIILMCHGFPDLWFGWRYRTFL